MKRGDEPLSLTITTTYENANETFLAMMCKNLRENNMTNEMILDIKQGKPTTLITKVGETGITSTTTWTVERGDSDVEPSKA